MDRTSLHLELRNALELADELSRFEHADGNATVAGNLRALGCSLAELERRVGRSHDGGGVPPDPSLMKAVARSLAVLEDRRDELPRARRRRFATLVAAGRRVVDGLERPGEPTPSKSIAGILPLARVLPQDAHTLVDWLACAACATSIVVAKTTRAKAVGAALAGVSGAVSLTTDCRGSAVRAMPIEAHEAIDHLWGIGAALAPFVLGYAKRDRLAAMLQIGAGVGMIVASLFSDYHAFDGATRPHRSRGGPESRARRRPGRVDGEIQRALEGLSSAPSTWQV